MLGLLLVGATFAAAPVTMVAFSPHGSASAKERQAVQAELMKRSPQTTIGS